MEAIIKALSVKVANKELSELQLDIDLGHLVRLPGFIVHEALEDFYLDYNYLVGEVVDIDFYERGELVHEKIRKHFGETNFINDDKYFVNSYDIGELEKISFDLDDDEKLKKEWYVLKCLCKSNYTIVKSIQFRVEKPYEELLSKKEHVIKPQVFKSRVLGLQVDIRNRAQNVYFILESLMSLKLESFLITNATGLEAHEFEMLIGRELTFSFYQVGERIPGVNELCQFKDSYIKDFQLVGDQIDNAQVLLDTSKIPFHRIEKITHPSQLYSKKGFIEIVASNGKKYFLNIKDSRIGYSWEYFLLEGSYFYPLESSRHDLELGKNVLLRLHSNFFRKLKNVGRNVLDVYQSWYKLAYYQSRDNNQTYSSEDAFRDVFGDHPDAIWNID